MYAQAQQRLKDELRQKAEQQDALQHSLNAARDEATSWKERFEAADRAAWDLRSRLVDRDARVAELEAQIAEREAQTRSKIMELTATIETLKSKLGTTTSWFNRAAVAAVVLAVGGIIMAWPG